jgi:DNA repair photolyase
MPGINDAPEQVERIVQLAVENGATGIGGIALHLRRGVREVFMDWLRSQRPDLVPRYEELYARGAYVGRTERDRIAGILTAARGRHRPRTARKLDRGRFGARRDERPSAPRPARRRSLRAPQQPSLF